MRRRDALRNTSNGIPDFETGGIAHLPMNLQRRAVRHSDSHIICR
jgi:hypothetical protein